MKKFTQTIKIIKYLCLKKNIRPSNDYFKNIIDFLTTYKPNFIIYRDIDVLNIKQIEQINLNSKLKSISILLSGFPPK